MYLMLNRPPDRKGGFFMYDDCEYCVAKQKEIRRLRGVVREYEAQIAELIDDKRILSAKCEALDSALDDKKDELKQLKIRFNTFNAIDIALGVKPEEI